MGILLQLIILCSLLSLAVAGNIRGMQWALLAVAALCALARGLLAVTQKQTQNSA